MADIQDQQDDNDDDESDDVPAAADKSDAADDIVASATPTLSNMGRVLPNLSPEQQAALKIWQDKQNKMNTIKALMAAQQQGQQVGGQQPSATIQLQDDNSDQQNQDTDEDDDNEDTSTPVPSSSQKMSLSGSGSMSSRGPASSEDDNEDDDDTDDLPAKGTNIGDVEALRAAQKQAQTNTMLANLGGIGANMAYGMGGRSNPNAQQYSNMVAQQGQLPVNNYLQQVEMQKYDPKSTVSEASRKLAAEMGHPQPENASAADIEKLIPQIANITTSEEAQETKRDTAQQRSDDLRFKYALLAEQRKQREVAQQASSDLKQQAMDSKRLDTYSAKAGLASSRSVLGQAQNQIYAVDRVDALLHNHGSLDNISPNEMVEVAKGLDRVISGGASTLEGSKSLDPQTAREWIAGQLQKISNTPQAAHGGAFLARIDSNLQREKETAVNQAARQYQMILAGSGDIAKRNPEAYGDFLDKLGVHPELKDYLMTGKKPMTIDQNQAALNNAGVGSPTSVTKALEVAPVGNTVRVQTSDGRIWNLPKDKLATAQERDKGLKVLQ